MDMSVTSITSDTLFSDIEHHFRVSAGPGAGKTHWLVEHIKNVLHNSNRLSNSRKIACITYTNIAVETILNRLGTSAEQVEVSTIHSFFYKNIVKPYVHFIAPEYNLNIAKMDGHDDIILTNYKFLSEWKSRTKQQRITDDNLLAIAFNNIKWKFEASGNLSAKTDYPHKIGYYPIRNDSYYVYKKMSWEKGVLHHDDVLFFSFEIVKKHPFVLDILRTKFPYFFVDEFQDSNPIQVEILKKIGQIETIVGIIGDKAQSIYGFQGADDKQFMHFGLPNIRDYIMAENRRSTNEIIDILNHVRKDIMQKKYRDQSGGIPILIIGDTISSLKKAQNLCGNGIVCSLSRINITSNAMKREVGSTNLNDKLLDELKTVDSNRDRSRLIISCIKAIELALEKKFKDAIKELQRLFGKNEEGKKQALKHLMLLISKLDDYKDNKLMDFYNLVKSDINNSLAGFKNGAAKDFYDNNHYKELALCVKIPEDLSHHKTIHKAKGDEFDNVLVVLQDEKDIGFLLNPDLENEEHRVRYVAISRAKEMLFISVPTLRQKNLDALKSLLDIQIL